MKNTGDRRSSVSAQPAAREFGRHSFVAGHMVLDFANTVTARDTTPRDFLQVPADFVAWTKASAGFDPAEVTPWEKRSAKEGDAALRRARRLREAVCRVFTASARGGSPPAEDLACLERAWQRSVGEAMLTSDGPRWTVGRSGADYVVHVLAWEAVELWRSPARLKVRVCDGSHCGWLFLDTSKSGRRRWCDMATCGNVAKARRHLARKQTTRGAED